MNISICIIKIIRNYLENRLFKLSFNSEFLEFMIHDSGIFQESISRYILFNIESKSHNTQITIYIDDNFIMYCHYIILLYNDPL